MLTNLKQGSHKTTVQIWTLIWSQILVCVIIARCIQKASWLKKPHNGPPCVKAAVSEPAALWGSLAKATSLCASPILKLHIWQCPPLSLSLSPSLYLYLEDSSRVSLRLKATPPSCRSAGRPKTTKARIKPRDRSGRAATRGIRWPWCSERSGETRGRGRSSTCWQLRLILSAGVRYVWIHHFTRVTRLFFFFVSQTDQVIWWMTGKAQHVFKLEVVLFNNIKNQLYSEYKSVL